MEVAIISSSGESVSSAIWNPMTNSLLASYLGGGSCSPHGLVASGGYIIANETNKPMIRAWPLHKQYHINKRMIAPGKITCVSISADNNYLALSVDSKFHIYQLASGVLCGTGGNHFQPINVIKFNPDSTFIGCGGEDGIITVWNLGELVQFDNSSKKPFLSVNAHSLPITDLFFTSGGLRSRVVTSSLDRSCKIHDIWTKDRLFSGHFENQLTSLALCPREAAFYIGDADGHIREVNLLAPPRKVNNHYSNSSGDLLTGKFHENRITCLSVSLDCSLLLSGSTDTFVKLIHIKSKQCLQTIQQKGPVTNCFFYIIPSDCFSTSFKPSFELHDFVTKESMESYCIEVYTSSDISSNIYNQYEVSEKSNDLIDSGSSSTSEVNNIKKINNELYSFALNRILDGSHKHQIQTQSYSESVGSNRNNNANKNPRKRKKVIS